ncbi:MAG: DUF4410 domain-containing protein [Verrucomicrobiota bacterium]
MGALRFLSSCASVSVAEESASSQKQVQADLAQAIESRLDDIVPTQIVNSKPSSSSGLWITGEFIRVKPDDVADLLIIGLGAGGTKIETKVQVYDLGYSKSKSLYVFKTTG